jgi:uncharacterized protein YndB with AHSA1/START domain
MPVIDVSKDPESLTLTVVAQLAATPERAWQLWEDPRQLDQWWGPPEWPATFYEHNLTVGGGAKYYMTGPDGTKVHGWWRFTALDPCRSLGLDDGFADENGEPSGDLGTTKMTATFVADGDGTRMSIVSHFESAEQLEEMLAMGMEEGMTLAVGQIDAIIAG